MHDRPDPDELLRQISAEDQFGKLKIYLGMASGVGKTFAMLTDALEEKERGVDVVVGYIEPHGRNETEDLAKSFEGIPLRQVEYRGAILKDLDLDLSKKRHPKLLLVDELAHTNAPGARHLKRWQDIEELLLAGINVHTTVNIQHIESLKDVVSKITGVSVQETVPDSFLSKASDIELIDIPPEELLQRLREGKIYKLEKVSDALGNFFSKGNLIALRELVLRHAAERVDEQMHKYRSENAVHVLWPTASTIMVCVGPDKMSERVVRIAKQIATRHHAQLIALSIEGTKDKHFAGEKHHLTKKALALAKQLGAETIVSSADDMVAEIIRISNEKNVSLLVIGKAIKPRWRYYFSLSLADEIIRNSGDHDVYVVTGESSDGRKTKAPTPEKWSLSDSFFTLLTTVLVTCICVLVHPYLELSNLIMLYLLQVAWVATQFGRYEAIMASITGVLAFDFFFVPPRMTFAVSDGQYLLTFVVMLVIGMLISSLTLRIRSQTKIVMDRERRTSALYSLTKKLSATSIEAEVQSAAREELSVALQSDVVVTICSANGKLSNGEGSTQKFENAPNEQAVIQWVIDNQQPAGVSTNTLPGSKGFYYPIISKNESLGAIGVLNANLETTQKTLLEAFTGQTALAIERIRNDDSAREIQVEVEHEKLKNSLLSSISHDLRTPLASITGAASVLRSDTMLDLSERRDLANSIHEEADRLAEIARNVLDMTRLEYGSAKINRDWNSIHELVGSALSRCEKQLDSRKVTVELPPSLPLILADGLLVDQLFVNLFENAARYTPLDSAIRVVGFVEGQELVVEFSDHGPGIQLGKEDKIFEKLYRLPGTGGTGFGLGLAICKAIMTAHQGSISASNNLEGGAVFTLRFPLEPQQPEVPSED